MKKKTYTQTQAFKALGAIDKRHEAKKITKSQHDSLSKTVLRRLAQRKK